MPTRSLACRLLRLPLPILLPALFAGTAHADASLTVLGMNPGAFRGIAFGVSDNGTVVGSTIGTTYALAGAYWSADGTVNLIPSTAGDAVSPEAISADGSTIVGNWSDVQYTYSNAFIYHPGDAQATFLDVPTVGDDGVATGVNHDGTIVVGGQLTSVGGTGQAIEWTGPNFAPTLLPMLAGGTATEATGTDDDGSVIAGIGRAATGLHMIYWANGQAPVDLGVPGETSEATGVSGDGSTIVGIGFTDPGVVHAYKLTGAAFDTRTDLGNLGGGVSEALGVDHTGGIIVGESSIDAQDDTHAFRYADGKMSDLNTLLTNAGVNLNGVVLTAATGISENGKYIAADELIPAQAQLPYLVYYDDGIGAITSGADQQGSVDGLGRQRQAIAIDNDAYSGLLIGDLDRQTNTDSAGVFGLVGSAVGGMRGRLGVGQAFTLTGGILDGSSEFAGATIGGGLEGAIALRYDDFNDAIGSFHPFGLVGGSFGSLGNLAMTRNYAGGTGTGSTTGNLGSVFGRVGLTGDVSAGDQLTFAAEIGERWLSTDAYAESFSADNPFPASVAAGTDSQTVVKFSASWSHKLRPGLDLTLRGAVGKTLAGSSGLAVSTTGLGTLGTGIDTSVFGEAGAHLNWSVTDRSSIDLYATSTFSAAGTAAHFGAGYQYSF